jgi:hypothetical protein
LAIKLDYAEAKLVLAAAVERAREPKSLPVEWVSHARTVFALGSKTYTPALATLLLAKATDPAVDTLSIKVTGDRSYSLRGLGHAVVVPAAVFYGFTLRVTGREPLNNQPWFRYDRIDEFERVRLRKDYDYFLEVARRADLLTADDALAALAAFIMVATDEATRSKAVAIKAGGVTAEGMQIAADDFLRVDAPDRPQRLQAFAAACLDLGHAVVRSRRLNDPSRDVPGDVHAYVNEKPVLAVEVRGKAVPATELESFIESCAQVGITRVVLLVDALGHQPIDVNTLKSHALSLGAVHLALFESAGAFLLDAITWADLSIDAATQRLAERVLQRLRQVEASKATLDEWVRAVALVQTR